MEILAANELRNHPSGAGTNIDKMKKVDHETLVRESDLNEIRIILQAISGQEEYEIKNDVEFENRLSNVMSELNKLSPEHQNIQGIRKAMHLKAKYALLDLCYTKALETEVDEKRKNIWEMIRVGHDQSFEELLSIVIGIKPEHGNEVAKMKTQITTMKREMGDILEVSQKMQDEIRRLMQEKAELQRRCDGEKADLIAKIEDLDSDNKKCFDTIQKYTKASQKESPTKIPEVTKIIITI